MIDKELEDALHSSLRAFDRAAVKAIVNGEAIIISASGHVDDLACLESDEEEATPATSDLIRQEMEKRNGIR